MKGFRYQLKLVLRDKMSILTFLLPLIIAVGIHLVNVIDLSPSITYYFAILDRDYEHLNHLEHIGNVERFGAIEALTDRINEPGDDVIGIVMNNNTPQAILSGDEAKYIFQIAQALPDMLNYLAANQKSPANIITVPRINLTDSLKQLLSILNLVMALFLGLTFNTINLVTEKEEGIIYLNGILPLSPYQYLLQKFGLGFLGSSLLAIITAAITWQNLHLLTRIIPVVLLSAWSTALLGLILGNLSSSFLSAIINIKTFLLFFLAVPLLVYLYAAENIRWLFHLLPSYTLLDGLMKVVSDNGGIWTNIIILFLQGCILTFISLLSRLHRSRSMTLHD